MYLALYRKYRPKTFDDVISQPHITTTLTNQIKTGSSAHAYLFTGSRGTGKTTCAKILAMAINCLNPRDGSPCLECANCKEIENGTPDVVEMDAASNNGVDDVRALRDEVAYTPVSCKKRVYIIDEVHMLSASAFNALLKTLEEPPPHVVFILATTESHKVPATILSRCQRFEFRRIDMEDSAARLMHIAELEKISLEKNAALLISRLSDGGMRDALSILDQCIGISDNVTTAVVRESAGVAGREHLFRLADCVKDSDTAGALKILDELHKSSKDIGRLVEELIGHFRNLMLLKVMPDDTSLVTALPDELDEFRRQNGGLSVSAIMRALSLLQECGESLSRTKQRKTLVEMYLIKLCNPSTDSSAAALAQRIERLESAVSGGAPLNISTETIERQQGAPLHTKNPASEEKLPEISKRPVNSAVSGMLDKIHELANAHSGEKPINPTSDTNNALATAQTLTNSTDGIEAAAERADDNVQAPSNAVEPANTETAHEEETSDIDINSADNESSEQLPFDLDESDGTSAAKPDEKPAAAPETPVFATSDDLDESESSANSDSADEAPDDDIDGQVGFDFPFGDEQKNVSEKSSERAVQAAPSESLVEKSEHETVSNSTEQKGNVENNAVTAPESVKSEASPVSTAQTESAEASSISADDLSAMSENDDTAHTKKSENPAFADDINDIPPPSEKSAPAAPDDFTPPPFDDYGAPPPENDELPPPEFSPQGLRTRLPEVPPEKPPVVAKKVEFEQGDFTPDEKSLVAKWDEITANAPAALGSFLVGSKAYFHDGFIHIYPANGMLESFLNIGGNKEKLENVAKDILGKSYKIVVVPPKVTNVRESSAVDKLFARARELGINVISIEK